MMFGMAAGVMLFSKGVSSVGGGMRDFADSGDARVPNGQRGGGNAAGLPDHAGAFVRDWVRMGCAAILLAVCLALIPAAQAVLNKIPIIPKWTAC